MVNPWIENCSMKDILIGNHFDPGERSMLIQITDPAYLTPIPNFKFREIYSFEFLDAEDADITKYGEEFLITKEQAEELVNLLKRALENNINVVVHCHAGFCRSGAVAEIGVMMGFLDTERFRSPNMRVKGLLMNILGFGYGDEI